MLEVFITESEKDNLNLFLFLYKSGGKLEKNLEKNFGPALKKILSFSEPYRSYNLQKIVEGFINEDRLSDAVYIAGFLHGQIKNEELKKIEKLYLEKGWIDSARRIAVIFPEPERSKELKKILEKYLEQGRFEAARNTLNKLSEPYKSQGLKEILEAEGSDDKLREFKRSLRKR